MQKNIDYYQKYSPICIVVVLGAVKKWLTVTSMPVDSSCKENSKY